LELGAKNVSLFKANLGLKKIASISKKLPYPTLKSNIFDPKRGISKFSKNTTHFSKKNATPIYVRRSHDSLDVLIVFLRMAPTAFTGGNNG
jgi:hypothetical protein